MMMKTRVLLVSLLVAMAGGCRTREGTLVEVSVSSVSTLSDVGRLTVHATVGSDSRSIEVPLATKSIPPTHVFAIEVSGKLTGTISVEVEAISSTNASVGKKSNVATLLPGSTVPLSIVIGSPDIDMASSDAIPTGDGGADLTTSNADLQTGPVVTPSSPSLGAGRYIQFMADTAVTWAVLGGDANGTISADGIYNAPFTPGTYMVTATSASGTTTITVVVKALVLSRIAGRIGGTGNANGVGVAAHFGNANEIAVARDSFQLFVADTPNHAIRQIDPSSGAVSVIAGATGVAGTVDGFGGDARFDGPRGLCQVELNVLYVWEEESGALRRVDTTTGEVSTLLSGADLGANRLLQMKCHSGTDQLFFLDGAAVRKLVLSTKTVTTVVATPEDPTAFDYEGNELVIATSHGVYTANLGDATPTAVLIAGSTSNDDVDNANGTLARFRYLTGVVIDSGSYLVADAHSCKLKRVDRAGSHAVTTAVGNADTCAGELDGDTVDGIGSAVRFVWAINALVQRNSSSQLFYVVERGISIREINLATPVMPLARTIAGGTFRYGLTQGEASTALINHPTSLVAVGDSVFVAEGGWKELATNVVRRLDLGSGMLSIAAGKPGVGTSDDGVGTDATFALARSLSFDGNDLLYVADIRTIRTFSITSGQVTTLAGDRTQSGYVDLTGSSARFGAAIGITFADGAAYVQDFSYPGALRSVTPAGNTQTFAGSSTETGYVDAQGLAARFEFSVDQDRFSSGASDGKGNLYVTDLVNACVRKIVLATGDVTTLAGNPTTKETVDGVGLGAGFEEPSSIAFDGNRTLYVGDKWTLRAIDVPSAKVTTVFGRPGRQGVSLGAAPASLNRVMGIARHVSGDLVLAVGEPGSDNTILRVTAP